MTRPASLLLEASLCGVLALGQSAHAADFASPAAPGTANAFPLVTNIAGLRGLLSSNLQCGSFRLEGGVWWARAAENRLVLKDDSGAEELELDLAGERVQPGEHIRLEGKGLILSRGAALQLGVVGSVVDNDGLHGMEEKSGALYLAPGRHPFRLAWFNGVEKFGLEIEYEGPGVPRQPVPDSVLWRAETTSPAGASHLVPGLQFRCYEGLWESLPNFNALTPTKTGATFGFALPVRSRDEHVALEFSGFIETLTEGVYSFHLSSDDGSRLAISAPSFLLTHLGTASPSPAPHHLAIGQALRESEDRQWATLDGKVTVLRRYRDGMLLELSAGAGRVRVDLADASGVPQNLAVNALVSVVGFFESAWTTDGQRVPGVILVPDNKCLQVLEPVAEGTVNQGPGLLPILTRASDVHRLKRDEAQRQYQVRVRGVVTSVLPEYEAFTIEDTTRGLYVEDHSPVRSAPPRLGEWLEVEGVTDPSKFAPIVLARRVASLGLGPMPAPVRPTWDQLMNGSLDAQYVEVQGIITQVRPDGVTMRTGDGALKVELRVFGQQPEGLRCFENALVTVRGCLFASWDYVTHHVKVGEVRIYDADVIVDQPAPQDLFATPRKTPAELLLFDPQAGVFQRVKVTGQIVFCREGECLLMDGINGLRCSAKDPGELAVGDLVDVVGFPELSGGAAPVLTEATFRKTGHAALPEAIKLGPDDLLRAEHDSTLVRIEGVLVSARKAGAGCVLEIQNGVRTFVARLNSALDEQVHSLSVGSRVELVGVYAVQAVNHASPPGIASFELLLNSATDIRVLARPPWWTVERLLVIVGALACVLAAGFLWISQLHRKVEERTVQLETQIHERERAEHLRAMEEERARIAQDLHDELGSGLTEISMLAERARSASTRDELREGHLGLAGGKAREMVAALDEIVWAMNPRHNSLASLVSYFRLYADRFLGLANIAWRFEGPPNPGDCEIDSRRRHQLFLAFKEALTNIVRHSGATEVRLAIQVESGQVRLSVADNGRGLPAGAPTEEMDGVANMRQRLEKLGGRFELASQPGRGTTLNFSVPAN